MGTHPLLKDIRINATIEREPACRLIQALSTAPATDLIYCHAEGHRTPNQPQSKSHTHTTI